VTLICGALEEFTYLLIVCHDREPCKAVEPIDIEFVLWTRDGPRSHVLDGGPDPPCEGGNCEGKRRGASGLSAVSCAKSVEPFVMQFMMWTPVGPRKHALNGGARCRYLTNISEPSTCGGDAAFFAKLF